MHAFLKFLNFIKFRQIIKELGMSIVMQHLNLFRSLSVDIEGKFSGNFLYQNSLIVEDSLFNQPLFTTFVFVKFQSSTVFVGIVNLSTYCSTDLNQKIFIITIVFFSFKNIWNTFCLLFLFVVEKYGHSKLRAIFNSIWLTSTIVPCQNINIII